MRPLLRSLCVLCLSVALLGAAGLTAQARVRPLNHEGILLDADGEPQTGARQLIFRLYDAPAAGALLWEETHDVELREGYYQVLLGSKVPLDLLDFQDNAAIYLGISLGGVELAPRHPITAVGYALVAEDVRGDVHPSTVTVGGRLVIDDRGRWVGERAGLEGAPGDDGANCYDGLADRTGDGVVDVADCLGEPGPVGPAGGGGSDTPQQILDKLNGAGFDEQPGSDLNADKVDGVHVTSLLRSDEVNQADIQTTGMVVAESFSVDGTQVISATRRWTGQPISVLADDLMESLVLKEASHLYRSARLSTLRVRATGAEFDGNRTRSVLVDGEEQSVNARGLHLSQILLADHKLHFAGSYDTAGSAADAAALALRLNSSGSDLVNVIASYDEWEGQRSPELVAALQRCGASATVAGDAQSSAYLLVGICGMGTGHGLELHQTSRADAMVEVLTLLVDGAVMGLSAGGGGAGGVQGDLTLPGNVIKSGGEIQDARAAFDFLRSTTGGASGYVFEEAEQFWGLYYDGARQSFVFTREEGGGASEQVRIDLQDGDIFTKGSVEALGTIWSHAGLQVGDPAPQLYLEHDGDDGRVGTHEGGLVLAPTDGDVRLQDRLRVDESVRVGAFPTQSVLHGTGLDLPVGNGALVPGVRVEGSRLDILGVGDDDLDRSVRVRSRLKVDASIEVDGPIHSDPVAGAASAGGKLVLGGAGAHGDVTIQDFNGSLRIYTQAGAAETVRIYGWGDGTAGLEVEGAATFEGGAVVLPAAPLLLPNAAAGPLGRIGLGVADPQRQLHVFNTTGQAGLLLETTGDGGSASWELVVRDASGLALHDLDSGIDRLRLAPDGTVAVGGPLDMGAQPVLRAGGLAFAAPGGAAQGLRWANSGARESAVYVSGHKDGRDASDGPLWFNSDEGFRWAADYSDDETYAMSLTATGSLLVPARLGVGSPAPASALEVRGVAAVLADLPPSPAAPPAVTALYLYATGSDELGRANQLLVGSTEADGTWAQIGLGRSDDETTVYAPAVLAYQATDAAAFSRGDLVFATRAEMTDTPPAERMRITAAGAVGVGTDAPEYALDVAGAIRSSVGGIVFPDGSVQTSAALGGGGGGFAGAAGGPLGDGLLAFWAFDGDAGDTVVDTLGRYPGAAPGTSIVQGKLGMARSLASSDVVTFGDRILPPGPQSVSFWIWPEGSAAGGQFHVLGNGRGTGEHGMRVALDNGNFHPTWFGMRGTAGTANFWLVCDQAAPLGRWTHVVMTWDGTTAAGAVRCYVDGDAAGSTAALSEPSAAATIDFFMGADENNRGINGRLDEVGVWSRALSAVEVDTLYNSGQGNSFAPAAWVASGSDLYTSNSGNVGVGVEQPEAKLHVAGDLLVEGSLQAPGLKPGPVLALNLDEGAGAAAPDSSGRSHHGVFEHDPGTADPVWVSGFTGRALAFNRTNWVRVEDHPDLHPTRALTLMAWVRPTDCAGQHYAGIITRGDHNRYYHYMLRTFGAGTCTVGAGIHLQDDTLPQVFAEDGALPDDVWTHVASVWDGATLRVYVNGVERASTPAAGVSATGPEDLHVRVGRMDSDVAGNYSFGGEIDAPHIYTRALSAEEINASYGRGHTSWVQPANIPPTACVPSQTGRMYFDLQRSTLVTCNGQRWSTLGYEPTGTRTNPAASCQDALDAGSSHGDGLYWIDPNGGSPDDALQVFCDMTTDGGGWMLVTPAMVLQQEGRNATVVDGVDANGGLTKTVYANAAGCGGPDSGHVFTLHDVIPWTKIRYYERFFGSGSCWAVFGHHAYQPALQQNTTVFVLGQDTIRDQLRMGGSQGNAFDGRTQRCDNERENYWHGLNGSGERHATVILRRNDPNLPAGLGTGGSCMSVAAGTASPTRWIYSSIWVR